MQDPNIINPLNNPIFYDLIKRFIILFLCGFFLILLLKKFRLKHLWESNLGKRYISWFFLGIIYLIGILYGGYFSLTFLFILMILAIYEVGKITKMKKNFIYSLYILSFISIYVASFHPDTFYMLPILYFSVFGMLSIRQNDEKGLFDLMLAFFVSIWIIFALCHLILLGHLNNSLDFDLGITSTKSLLFLVGFCVALADIGFYIAGKGFTNSFLDKYKIANKISKNKTYIGVSGGIVGAGIGIAIMYFVVKSYFSIYELIILAFLIGIFATIGDLMESLFKRYFDRKDSSRLIPGHGGILDRIDSLLRVIIIVYYFTLAVT